MRLRSVTHSLTRLPAEAGFLLFISFHVGNHSNAGTGVSPAVYNLNMFTVHYSKNNWRHGTDRLATADAKSLEEAKAAIPSDCTFAVIFTEDFRHVFSPAFKWQAYAN